MITVTEKTDLNELNWLCRNLKLADAHARSYEDSEIKEASKNSLCFWAHEVDGEVRSPIGFVRVLTDGSLISTITDFFVIMPYRGRGIGRQLIQAVLAHPRVAPTGIILSTATARGFYEKFGFRLVANDVMVRTR